MYEDITAKIDRLCVEYARTKILAEIAETVKAQVHWEEAGDLTKSRYCAEVIFTLQELMAHQFPDLQSEEAYVSQSPLDVFPHGGLIVRTAKEERNEDGRHPIG
jgi:hypothetical protein